MEKEQALNVIEQALNIAIGKGIFKVEDSTTVLASFISIKNLLNPPVDTPLDVPLDKNTPKAKPKE